MLAVQPVSLGIETRGRDPNDAARLESTMTGLDGSDGISNVLEDESERDRVERTQFERDFGKCALGDAQTARSSDCDGFGARVDAMAGPSERLHVGEKLTLSATDVQEAGAPGASGQVTNVLVRLLPMTREEGKHNVPERRAGS